ncbi:hypothetical protein [Streptomyces sp. RKAG293]|uniref:hypothetical protein n=1 Tax=Streptomyces sp. RKAG293 TaxID=2893403 RepID=UPI0020333C21|nr:hypothetical protein [Streptomyces sp. RKAG293]MCM2422826.1 hypothetical protein [Streptomyces sp. RKAG293]
MVALLAREQAEVEHGPGTASPSGLHIPGASTFGVALALGKQPKAQYGSDVTSVSGAKVPGTSFCEPTSPYELANCR